MKKILMTMLVALAIVLYGGVSYAQGMKQPLAINANVTVKKIITPENTQAVEIRAYLQGGNWLAVNLQGPSLEILKGGTGTIELHGDDTPEAGYASYCLSPPEVPRKQVEPDCKPIHVSVMVHAVDMTDDGFIKGAIVWTPEGIKGPGLTEFDTKWKR